MTYDLLPATITVLLFDHLEGAYLVVRCACTLHLTTAAEANATP